MRFENVCIESLATAFPEETWSSAAIEERLRPLYERLKLPFGRLELMTGIKERRFWPDGTQPSQASAAAGKAVLARSGISPDKIGLFIHAAVCRDMLEPSTASFAHRLIGLPEKTQIMDVSNACLGFLNALTLAAGLIECGQIGAALVVSGENGRPLVEQTLRTLLDKQLDRNQIKPFFANLTIGSGAVGAVVCHRSLAKGPQHRLLGGVATAATQFNDLCRGDTHGAEALQMQTDSEALLVAGVQVARRTWQDFMDSTGWNKDSIDRTICHQVGATHRRKLYEMLELDIRKDFSSFENYGNVGSVSLPATLALAVEGGAVKEGHRVALLGIGSGINCMMLALEW
ncbi:MAG: 3-oxoacyl-ACP synthase III [Opitutaceae bacterium]|jgi:3-oxoacyl-[acyl-carrier-protein] synthase-3